MNKRLLISFGKKIRMERRRQGISQEKLAELADLHRNYIGMIERAEINITLLNIEKLAKALKTTPVNLLRSKSNHKQNKEAKSSSENIVMWEI
ncbi:MAG: helix-turn-helix transcriptional regulator [Candidatus Omnitrophica bacterium]|nr:helix-turn-helix transcriptional regulator [Candidatus Omnitrophota bacterium]MDE2009521.1 helix-turn-helix transcriptional regulator [Candidatus Omnitrophota bacterium]MDE2214565.1 helix-turn-helix transcriptional regulator [Candidatus Omnitrophota bacterium]MDE2231642.1 helix-turn-helix transcriptional regulator [Candidatus Omnitrophota bacterium]